MRKKIEMPQWKRNFFVVRENIRGILSKTKLLIKVGPLEILKKMRSDEGPKQFELAIVTIVKNEGDYICEWIEYHKLIGFTRFYIFDNDSNDDIETILKPYIADNSVVLTKIKGEGRQIEAIDLGLRLAQNESRWVAVIDADEFIVPLNGENILKLLNEKNKHGLLIGWMIYGSSDLLKKPAGLVIENFTKHAKSDFIADYKMIVNPRKVLKVIHPHFIQVLGKITNENGKRIYQYPYVNVNWRTPAPMEKIRINHYYSKSYEEFEVKSKKGFADGAARSSRNLKDFKEHDQNFVDDRVMEKYIAPLKKNMEMRTKNKE